MKNRSPIPVTILTGFLGAGKTTLLNHLLTQPHGYRCAVVINEFGAEGIDGQLVTGVEEEILELNNGCICCRVRGDLVKSLGTLLRNPKRIDYILIETTGLADPSPVAHTFMVDPLAGQARLDAIITVVDARLVERQLETTPETRAQIAFADVLLLNKADLANPTDLARIERRLRQINGLASIHRTERSAVDAGLLLNVKARDVMTALEALPSVEEPAGGGHVCDAHCDHDHEHDHDPAHGHDSEHPRDPGGPGISASGSNAHDEHDRGDGSHAHHDEDVWSFVIREPRPLDLKKAEAWLGELLSRDGERIYRSKGILNIQGQAKRVVFQGVQMMFEATPERLWKLGETRESRMVFIGKDLDEAGIRAGFEKCLARG